MSYSDQRLAVVKAIVGANLSIPIKWPNAEFNTPNNAMWARADLRVTGADIYSLKHTDEVRGLIIVDLFAPKDAGDVELTAKADTLVLALKRKVFVEGGVKVMTFAASANPMPDEPAWYGIKVAVDFMAFHPA